MKSINEQPINASVNSKEASSHKTKLVFAIIFAMPVTAIVLSLALYYSGWQPSKTRNYGKLFRPVLPLAKLNFEDQSHNIKTGQQFFAGRWSLTLVQDMPCLEVCKNALDQLGRVRAALAKSMERTRIVWIGQGALEANREQIVPPGSRASDFEAAQLNGSPDFPSVLKDKPFIVLVDPLGNVVLRYRVDESFKGIRDDLYQLLKYSWVG